MAPKQLTRKNKLRDNRGQALTEALLMLLTALLFLYFMLRALLVVIFTVAVDAMVEDYFYCELAGKPFCQQRLEQRLQQNQLRAVVIQVRRAPQKISLSVTASHLATLSITREFDYEKFKQEF